MSWTYLKTVSVNQAPDFLPSPNSKCQSAERNTKHWPQPVAWPYLFFVHQWAADRRLVALSVSHPRANCCSSCDKCCCNRTLRTWDVREPVMSLKYSGTTPSLSVVDAEADANSRWVDNHRTMIGLPRKVLWPVSSVCDFCIASDECYLWVSLFVSMHTVVTNLRVNGGACNTVEGNSSIFS